MDTFDEDYLNDLEKELKYIEKLIANRRKELLPKEIRYSLNVKRFKRGNEKLCKIELLEYEQQFD